MGCRVERPAFDASTKGEIEKGSRRSHSLAAFVLLIAFFSIPKRKSNADRHSSKRWDQQNQNGPAQRALPILRRTLRALVAHLAPLREGRRCRERQHKSQHPTGKAPGEVNSVETSCHYFTPNCKIRSASGKKKKYMITKQADTEITSSQRISARSNFRCMK